jgi:hypothetical protein
MRTTTQILASYRDRVKQRFVEMTTRRVESLPADIPTDPKQALELGLAMGRREGYSTGLVDGTQLGLDVGLEAVDEMLSQPVFFGTYGMA